jgi:UDP-N-acetylglucosamine/UDP-N-acetyl-alpha-D-glucosaminouronate 4-epimerase
VFLVTGGAGFIGSHLVERLLQQGESVRVFDDFDSAPAQNLTDFGDRVDLIVGDIRKPDAVCHALDGVDVVFHLAAITSVQRSIENPQTTLEVNIMGTANVLVAAHRADCRRVVFASSAAVYGDTSELPVTEVTLPHPLSPYAVSKLAGEHLCAVFTRVHELETVSLRYFNVFGPRQEPSSPYSGVISRFVEAIRTGARPTIYGDGEQSRDFVYVDNVVDANLQAASRSGIAGQVFNIGSGQATSLNALLETLGSLTGTESRADYQPARPGDIRHSVSDISRAREALGYDAGVSLEEGLAEMLNEGQK